MSYGGAVQVFRLLVDQGHKQTLLQWILICAPNFINIRQHSRATWGLACLFIPLADHRAVRALFWDIARTGHVSADLFMLVAFHFFTLLVRTPLPLFDVEEASTQNLIHGCADGEGGGVCA